MSDTNCQWCKKKIKEYDPACVLPLTSKAFGFTPPLTEKDKGTFASVFSGILGRPFYLYVLPETDPLYSEEYDLAVVTCCAECLEKIKDVIVRENALINHSN